MTPKRCCGFFLITLLLLTGCASLQPGYELPVVSITRFEAIPGQGIIPQFKIGLHIVNPNRTPLTLNGVSYTIFLDDHKIMTGVSNQLPTIDAYGEGDLVLNAAIDFFSGIGFFTELMQNRKKETINYRLDTKMDVGALYPLIRVVKKGTLSLNSAVKTDL